MIYCKTFNAGYQNLTVSDIARTVKKVVSEEMPAIETLTIETTESDDKRSYHISSEKIKNELGFLPKHTIEDAIRDLVQAFKDGKLEDAMDDSKYYNIKVMQEVELE